MGLQTRFVRVVVCLFGASTLIAACGGSSSEAVGGPDEVATPAEVRTACSNDCEHSRRCDGGNDDACIDECLVDKLGSVGRRMRSDALRAYSDCMATLACDRNDDDCENAMYTVLGKDASALQDHPDVKACEEAKTRCPSGEDTIDEFCIVQLLLATEARGEFVACFSEPCETLHTCGRRAFYGGG